MYDTFVGERMSDGIPEILLFDFVLCARELSDRRLRFGYKLCGSYIKKNREKREKHLDVYKNKDNV